MSKEHFSLVDFMRDQISNNEAATDEELVEHLGSEGVPNWLAKFYVDRRRQAALAAPIYRFAERDPVIDACVHLAAGYAEDKTMYDASMVGHAESLSSLTREIVAIVEERDRLKALVQQAAVPGGIGGHEFTRPGGWLERAQRSSEAKGDSLPGLDL